MAGFLACSPKCLPTPKGAVATDYLGLFELTATGIAPDFDRIPFY